MQFISNVISFFGSPTFGVVLTLLLMFQWHKQYAKEQTVKNILFAMRRKVLRNVDTTNSVVEFGKAHDTVDDIDAILSTLNSRKPFSNSLNKLTKTLNKRTDFENQEELLHTNTLQLLVSQKVTKKT